MGVHQNFSLSHKFEIQNEMQKKYEEIHCELDSVWYHEVKKSTYALQSCEKRS